MKRLALAGLIAGLMAFGGGPLHAAGMFEGFPDATFPLTGDECVPADTNLSGGRVPQTQCIDIDRIRGYSRPHVGQEITSSTSVSLDLSLTDTYSLTLSASGNLSEPTNPSDGQMWSLVIVQGAGTGWGLSYDSNFFKFASNTVPTLTTIAGNADMLVCQTVNATHVCELAVANYTP